MLVFLMSKSKFTKHLKELGIEELRHELLDLYAKVPAVKQHYAMELGSDQDRQRLYIKAKKNIESKYATKSYRRPRRPRIQKINAVLADMRKATIFKHELVDLYLFDLEVALVFSVKYRFYSQTLGNHITTVFEKATDIIMVEQLQEMFKERAQLIVDRSELIPEIHWLLVDKFKSCFELR